MTGRWSCVLLLAALAACRTPQKKVSIYSLDPDEFGAERHRPAGSDVGETDARRMNLPNYADTETASNSLAATAPGAANLPSVEVESTLAGKPKQFSQESGFPLTRSRNDAEPASPPMGRGTPNRTAIPPRPTGGEAGPNATVVCGSGDGRGGIVNWLVSARLPVESDAQPEALHVPSGGHLSPVATTNPTALLDLPVRHNVQNVAPVSQPIHLSLPSWTNSASQKSARLIDWNNSGPATAFAPQPFSANLSRSAWRANTLAGVSGPDRSVDLPAVGKAPIRVVGTESQPVDLEPLLAGSQDADWRLRQTERQRAEETARQSERDRLAKSLQQLLQPGPK